MSDEIKMELTPEAVALLKEMREWPVKLGPALAKEMDRQNLLTIAHIQEAHLTGQGPFPPEQHRLGVKTSRLRGAVWASAAVADSSGRVESAIGDNVSYAVIHEFGKVYQRKAGKVRLATDRGGNVLGRFAKRSRKNFKEVAYGAHKVVVPARAPFRTGIEERGAEYGRGISEAIIKLLGGTQQ